MTRQWLGRLLMGVRAGENHLAWNDAVAPGSLATIALTSSAFPAGGRIPPRYAGKGVGENRSPPLAWSGIPGEAKELVIVVEDPDAPLPRPFVHAVAFAIPAALGSLDEGRLSSNGPLGNDGISLGKNTFGQAAYAGPRPIPGHGPHTYVFQIFAVNRRLRVSAPASRRALIREMRGAVIARGRLDGVYER
jgi:Raf kinase inhibitor-like YbhB/YbcL family protein